MSDRIKILLVNSTMNMGGIESFLMNLVKSANPQKFDFTFLTYSEDHFYFQSDIEKLNYRIIRIRNPKEVSKIRHIRNIWKVLRSTRPDIVHINTYYDSIYVLVAAKLLRNIRAVVHSHTAKASTEHRFIKKIQHALVRFFMPFFKASYIACSPEAGAALFGKTSFNIIKNGVNIDKYTYSKQERKSSRKHLDISEKATVIGHVGRLQHPKNQSFLIDIFYELQMKSKSNYFLVLVGDGSDRRELCDKVRSLKISKRVIFLGNIDYTEKILNIFDIMIFPSMYEGLPIALVEAQANGLRCLVSDKIDKNIKLTDALEFYSLDEPATQWAKKASMLDISRTDTGPMLQKSGFDIENSIQSIEQLYSNLLKKKL
jgi:glycosyltransferase involved in cell wall biosynthesis